MAEAHSFEYEGSRGQVLHYHESDTPGPQAAVLKVVSADGSEQVIIGSDAVAIMADIDANYSGTILAFDAKHSPLAQIVLTKQAVRIAIAEGLENAIGN